MGTVIKAKRDGFRRAGLVHKVAGTFYQDGDLSEQQLAVLRDDPHLLVVEGVQEDVLQADQDNTELMQELRNTIATLTSEASEAIAVLERDLAQARAGLQAASSDLVNVLDRQKAVPGLVVEAAKLLAPADPAQEGVICILPDRLAELISEHLKALEAQDDGRKSTLDSADSSEPPPSPAPAPAVAPSIGDNSEDLTEKVRGKRGSGAAGKTGGK
ncbi:HI1506-related protein [Pseudomonas asplenii]|uniref:HI1506-related protein n=1 Tax=Pseudomonas asplenii TaxID=53407 RepID=UPI0037CB8B70